LNEGSEPLSRVYSLSLEQQHRVGLVKSMLCLILLVKAIFKVRQEQANKLLQEAFYDPELAKALSETKDNSLKIHDKTAGLLKKRLVQMSLQSFVHTRDDPADDNVE